MGRMMGKLNHMGTALYVAASGGDGDIVDV